MIQQVDVYLEAKLYEQATETLNQLVKASGEAGQGVQAVFANTASRLLRVAIDKPDGQECADALHAIGLLMAVSLGAH